MNSAKQKLETIQFSPHPDGWNERRAAYLIGNRECEDCRAALEILASGIGPTFELECSTECPQCGERGPTFTFHRDGSVVLWRYADAVAPAKTETERCRPALTDDRPGQVTEHGSRRSAHAARRVARSTGQATEQTSLVVEMARRTVQQVRDWLRRGSAAAGLPTALVGLLAVFALAVMALILHAIDGMVAVVAGAIIGSVAIAAVANRNRLSARWQEWLRRREAARRETEAVRRQEQAKREAEDRLARQPEKPLTTADVRRKAAEDFARFRVESAPRKLAGKGDRAGSEYDSSHFFSENLPGIIGLIVGIVGAGFAYDRGVPVEQFGKVFVAVSLLVLIFLGTPFGTKYVKFLTINMLFGGGDFGAGMGTGLTANRKFKAFLSPLSCLSLAVCITSGFCIMTAEPVAAESFAESSHEAAAPVPVVPSEVEPDDPGRLRIRISDSPLTSLIALHNDHRLLVTTFDGSLVSIDLATHEARSLITFDTGLTGLAVSRDGTQAVVSGKSFFGLRSIDLKSRSTTASTKTLDDPLSVAVGSFCFGPESDVLLGGLQNGRVAILNAITLESERATDAAGSAVTCIAGSHDGRKLYSGDRDGAVFERDFLTGTTLRNFYSGNGEVLGLSISPDGRWLAACNERGLACVWSLDDATLRAAFTVSGQSLIQDPNPPKMTALAFLPNSDLLAIGTRNGAVSIHSCETGEPLSEWRDHSDSISGVACVATGSGLSMGKLASAGRDGQVVLRTLPDSLPLTADPETDAAARTAESQPQSSRAEPDRGQSPRSGRLQFEPILPAAEGVAERLVISPNGKELIALGRDGNLKLNLPDGRVTQRDAPFPEFWSDDLRFGVANETVIALRNQTTVSRLEDEGEYGDLGSLSTVSFAASGRSLIAGWTGGAVTRHSANSGRIGEAFQLPGRTSAVLTALLPGESGLLVVDVRGKVTLHNTRNLKLESTLLELPHATGHAAFHPTQPWCAIGSRYQSSSISFSPGLTVFDTDTGDVLLQQDDHLEAGLFTPDGRFFMSTTRSRLHAALTVWDTTNWTQRFISRVSDRISSAALTHDGQRLIVGFENGGIASVNLAELLAD